MDNYYEIPEWFFSLIQDLIERLRQTNDLVDRFVEERRGHDENTDSYVAIHIDDERPNHLSVSGQLGLSNIEHIDAVLMRMHGKGQTTISLDLSSIAAIDRDAIGRLLRIARFFERSGGRLAIEGPQRRILELYRQYDVA